MYKRAIAWIAAAFLAVSGAACAESEGRLYAAQLAGSACLLDEEGRAATEKGEYRLIYELTGADDEVCLFAAESADEGAAGYALLNARGERLTGFEYQVLEYSNGRLRCMKGERWGAMNPEGETLLPAQYTSLIDNGEGGYLAQKTDPYDDLADVVYWIDDQFEEHESGVKISGGAGVMSEGMTAVSSAENALYGYLNARGEWALEPQYSWADAFRDGYAQATTAEGSGLIDATGQWVLEPKYGYLNYAGVDSMIVATEGTRLAIIDPKTMREVRSYDEPNAYAYALRKGGAVVMLEDGAVLVGMDGRELRLDGCRGINQWGEMNEQMIVQMGEYGTPSVYLYGADGTAIAGPYQDVMPLGKRDGEMYYVFTSFESTQTEYEGGLTFWDEVPGTRRCGVLSPTGEELCAFDAEYISYVGEGRMLVQQDGAAEFADFEGNVFARIADEAAGVDEAGQEE